MDWTDKTTTALTQAGLNLIAQALSIYDADLCLVIANRPFQRMFDLPDALVSPGAHFEDTVRHLVDTGEYGPVEDPVEFVQQRVDQARAFEPHYMERTRSNGRTISVEGAPLPQGGWVTVYTDISQAKSIETVLRARSEVLSDQLLSYTTELSAANRRLAAANAALEETKRELTDMEAHTRHTTEMMPAHIAHVDDTGRYTYSNGRLASVLPGRPVHLLGQHISDALGATAYGKVKPYLNMAYSGREAAFEFTDGHSNRRIRSAFTPDGSGGVYILSMDVTEESQARAALQQAHRRATSAQLINGLAHDFSNLLTVILALQGKLARLDLPDPAGDMVSATKAAAERGGRILTRIGDMTGQSGLHPTATDLHGLLQDLKILAGPTLPRDVGLSVVDMLPQMRVFMDADRLQDALLNLILNARDACGASGLITVSAHVSGEAWIEVMVTDTGPGFSEAAMDQALHPFYTTKGGEGSGLGLPMVYDMVKLAGGRLDLSNTPTGAAVTIRLPYRPVPAPADGLFLVAEDNDDLRESVREMLTGLGFAVIEAASIAEAQRLMTELPDITRVLSDIRLQDAETGLDLIDPAVNAGIMLVLMTSLPPSDPLHAQAALRVPVLQKPVRAADVLHHFLGEAAV